jgi:hypothetical protein
MQGIDKAQNLSGIMLACACLFALGTVGLASAINHRSASDDAMDGMVSFETLQDCEQQANLEVAAHFDKEVREGLVDAFCTKSKAAGLIDDIPVSAAGMVTSPSGN